MKHKGVHGLWETRWKVNRYTHFCCCSWSPASFSTFLKCHHAQANTNALVGDFFFNLKLTTYGTQQPFSFTGATERNAE